MIYMMHSRLLVGRAKWLWLQESKCADTRCVIGNRCGCQDIRILHAIDWRWVGGVSVCVVLVDSAAQEEYWFQIHNQYRLY